MRVRRILASIALLTFASTATPALAQTDAPKSIEASEPAAKPARTQAAATGEVRRDPEGKTGISPYMEAVAKGEKAFVARDFPGAVAAFQEAIKLDGQRMLGFFRLGEAQLASGNLVEADATWQAGLTKKGPPDVQAKVLFCIAGLRERQGKWLEAKDAWGQYTSFLQSDPKAFGYPATAIERQKQLDRRMKDEKDSAAVKQRIATRQAEREQEALENAKKDKLNR